MESSLIKLSDNRLNGLIPESVAGQEGGMLWTPATIVSDVRPSVVRVDGDCAEEASQLHFGSGTLAGIEWVRDLTVFGSVHIVCVIFTRPRCWHMNTTSVYLSLVLWAHTYTTIINVQLLCLSFNRTGGTSV